MSERKTLFVDVILPLALANEFTYRVPFELNEDIQAGVRVVVPFGRGKLYTAIVTKVHETIPTDYQAKYVEHLLDDKPIITQQQYQFWKWIAAYYMAPIGDVMNAALPGNFKLASETIITLHPDFVGQYDLLDDREYQIVEALEVQGKLDLKNISEIIGIKSIQPLVKKLIDQRIVISLEELNHKYTPKTATFVCFAPAFQFADKINLILDELMQKESKRKQADALLKLLELGHFEGQDFSDYVLKKDLENAGISTSALSTLEKNGVLQLERLQIDRIQQANQSEEQKELSIDQERAFQEIKTSFQTKDVCLLHGVTGSGKTEIYVKLIQEQLDLGKQVLFLLPEIALTTQLIVRLAAYFGEQIGVYHSKFNANERVEIWNHVIQKDAHKYKIVLGARSSVFLPFRNLGLVIVDEEHENTFKQFDPSPRYHARDASIVLAAFFKAKVLLASATPSIESYFNAQEDRYGFVELKQRFGNIMMPEICCADMNKETKEKTVKGHFSSFLLNEMEERIANKEQIILFQNRRGYTPSWTCEVCAWIPRCVNCDVSLTYHKHANLLKCHYCSYVTPPMGSCKSCGSNRIKMKGFGTEKIEDDLQDLLPDARISRLDLDTTRSKNAYQTILSEFDEGKIDILIGTQMLSKGLDFSRVSMVGILDADMLLNRPDFRAFERSFQLMTQVAGRAGRKYKRGKVIVQTKQPDHWIIEKVMQNDYVSFYTNELVERRNFHYPPFYKLIVLTLKHKDNNVIDSAAKDLADALKGIFGERILGPEYPLVQRIFNFYLKQITIKIERDLSQKKVKDTIASCIENFYAKVDHRSVRISIDVDPQ